MKSSKASGPSTSTESPPDPCRPAGESGPGRRQYRRHGFYALKATLRTLGPRVLDRRTSLGKQLAAWRSELVRDLGGDLSTQQLAIIDLAVRTRLLLESVDAWLLTQVTLVDVERKALIPVVKDRQQLSDALARYMTLLGLERRAKPVDLAAQLAALHGDPAP